MNETGQSPIVRVGFGIGAFIFVMSGPVSGYFLTRIFLEARASANWPSVSGTLTKAEVGETRVGRFFADVAYTYRVGETEFTGTKVRASDGEYGFRDGAVQAIRGLSVGEAVTVFYDPSLPRRAVLRAGAGFQEYALLTVPVAMFGIGVWSFRLLWRTRRRT
ncbi:MAG: DUF3592 domain-containing protein [Planctomycetaceae bacterium]